MATPRKTAPRKAASPSGKSGRARSAPARPRATSGGAPAKPRARRAAAPARAGRTRGAPPPKPRGHAVKAAPRSPSATPARPGKGRAKPPAPAPVAAAPAGQAAAGPVTAFLAGLEGAQHRAMASVVAEARAAAPGATEAVSYGMPALKLGGKAVAGFAAARDHLSLFPMSGSVLEAFAADLAGHSTSKGTVRFTPEHTLPAGLARRIVEARMREAGVAGAAGVAPEASAVRSGPRGPARAARGASAQA